MLSKLREPVNGLTHLVAAAIALVGLVILVVIGWEQSGKVISLVIYGISLVTLFLASGLYHSVLATPRVVQRLRKFDHSAIFLLIAGTYTPICTNLLAGFWKWGLLGIVWGLALAGIGVKIFFINAPRWVTAGVYILMGWLSIFGIREMLVTMPVGAIIWLAAGGLIYTLGAVVYITKRMDFLPGVFGFHEVWHIFVILGALAHFIMIATYVAPVP
ncbi:MAG: hemolysin III family protein [Anaerolineales bacterium]|nr:hemolysin III family protein [Anaerolineales bacterium]